MHLCCRCCALARAPAAVDAALVAICHLAASSSLQHMLLEVGALPYLVPLLLEYDVTLSPEASARLQLPFSVAVGAPAGEDGAMERGFKVLDSALVRPNMQEARTQHALLAAQALGRLTGMHTTQWHLLFAQQRRSFLLHKSKDERALDCLFASKQARRC